ncbi:hypothetical protein BO83DRAFT_197162 [Aspergillus eucalypticola CBS 122712]|uniref:Uncharacterized protein n=1 Tax=Aspergillus eucalypticola (strain CBS 122712 / IBT 29274) TaxID=1448314 RepID=A0A317W3J4_ASPEC|nr:uncharacterized protein BO83DRAFT_197162 [Aspergillus eucalypticola CBS 122712]PWY79862.1 hypothetical protein BO83DRAFT_197162 [Aspergillus eucalypticola CBS 122712]
MTFALRGDHVSTAGHTFASLRGTALPMPRCALHRVCPHYLTSSESEYPALLRKTCFQTRFSTADTGECPTNRPTAAKILPSFIETRIECDNTHILVFTRSLTAPHR